MGAVRYLESFEAAIVQLLYLSLAFSCCRTVFCQLSSDWMPTIVTSMRRGCSPDCVIGPVSECVRSIWPSSVLTEQTGWGIRQDYTGSLNRS